MAGSDEKFKYSYTEGAPAVLRTPRSPDTNHGVASYLRRYDSGPKQPRQELNGSEDHKSEPRLGSHSSNKEMR